VIDVPIRGNDGDLEYKIQMKAGSTVVYSWEVRNLAKPEEVLTPNFTATPSRSAAAAT